MKIGTTLEHGELNKALFAVQKTMGVALKNATNPHFKSKYADLGSVMDALKPLFLENGLLLTQSPTSAGEEGNVCALTTRITHVESGEYLEDTAVAPILKRDPQAYGSTLTYLRRYTLSALLGLLQDDDDGNAGAGLGPRPGAPTQKETIDATQAQELQSKLDQLPPARQSAFLKYKKIASIDQLPRDQYMSTGLQLTQAINGAGA